MSQDSLGGLALFHLQEVASIFDYSNLIAQFAKRESRKVVFMQAWRSPLMSCILKQIDVH
jgi:hypothetical protein